jgi:carbohydrate diacid regulator
LVLFIPKRYAELIVTEISKLIKRNLAFIDTSGVILVSTESHRNGTFHAGAKKLIDEGLEELAIYADNAELQIKKGVHTAIVLNDEIVGVIGITGDPADIFIYIKMIKSFTEIFIKNLYQQEQLLIEEQARNSFVEEWLFPKNLLNEESFVTRGKLLGIDVFLPRAVVIMQIEILKNSGQVPANASKDLLLFRVFKSIQSFSNFHSGEISIAVNDNIIIILPGTIESIKQKVIEIKKYLEGSFAIHIYGGISAICSDYREIAYHYGNAKIACSVASNCYPKKFMVYDDLSIEFLTQSIPPKIRNDYFHKVFSNCTDEELEEWFKILNAYFSCNGAINKAAQLLCVHKNTLQYKIYKIIDRLGYDPRKIKDAFALYLAMLSADKRH